MDSRLIFLHRHSVRWGDVETNVCELLIGATRSAREGPRGAARKIRRYNPRGLTNPTYWGSDRILHQENPRSAILAWRPYRKPTQVGRVSNPRRAREALLRNFAI